MIKVQYKMNDQQKMNIIHKTEKYILNEDIIILDNFMNHFTINNFNNFLKYLEDNIERGYRICDYEEVGISYDEFKKYMEVLQDRGVILPVEVNPETKEIVRWAAERERLRELTSKDITAHDLLSIPSYDRIIDIICFLASKNFGGERAKIKVDASLLQHSLSAGYISWAIFNLISDKVKIPKDMERTIFFAAIFHDIAQKTSKEIAKQIMKDICKYFNFDEKSINFIKEVMLAQEGVFIPLFKREQWFDEAESIVIASDFIASLENIDEAEEKLVGESTPKSRTHGAAINYIKKFLDFYIIRFRVETQPILLNISLRYLVDLIEEKSRWNIVAILSFKNGIILAAKKGVHVEVKSEEIVQKVYKLLSETIISTLTKELISEEFGRIMRTASLKKPVTTVGEAPLAMSFITKENYKNAIDTFIGELKRRRNPELSIAYAFYQLRERIPAKKLKEIIYELLEVKVDFKYEKMSVNEALTFIEQLLEKDAKEIVNKLGLKIAIIGDAPKLKDGKYRSEAGEEIPLATYVLGEFLKKVIEIAIAKKVWQPSEIEKYLPQGLESLINDSIYSDLIRKRKTKESKSKVCPLCGRSVFKIVEMRSAIAGDEKVRSFSQWENGLKELGMRKYCYICMNELILWKYLKVSPPLIVALPNPSISPRILPILYYVSLMFNKLDIIEDEGNISEHVNKIYNKYIKSISNEFYIESEKRILFSMFIPSYYPIAEVKKEKDEAISNSYLRITPKALMCAYITGMQVVIVEKSLSEAMEITSSVKIPITGVFSSISREKVHYMLHLSLSMNIIAEKLKSAKNKHIWIYENAINIEPNALGVSRALTMLERDNVELYDILNKYPIKFFLNYLIYQPPKPMIHGGN